MSIDHAALVDRVVAAVAAVDGVAGIYSGGPGSPATYLPGRTISGVRIGDDSGLVCVVLEYRHNTNLFDLAGQVRQVATAAAGVPVEVIVSDISVPADSDSGASESSKEYTS